ncbi:hypothetical protein [Akkermansia muciniphila]|jgi:hypothetical protein|uniref:hypothetical protein n=1 Tax=Akkermansia muciniphila TaxID=239935 RepID=UPI000FE166DE|nr:hypothetical protein [Akkermansia muciniphila]QAA37106.1 hypothetical protein C1I88_09485 [Akkermansia muciniphila]
MKKLSDKEDEFCKMVVWESFTPRAAYAVVWNPGDDASASAGASRKMREPHIQEELKRLRSELDDGYALSAKEKRRFLAKLVRGEVGVDLGLFDSVPTVQEVMTAIKIDNEMAGHNAPSEVHVGGPTLAEAIFGLLGDQSLKVGGNSETVTDGE